MWLKKSLTFRIQMNPLNFFIIILRVAKIEAKSQRNLSQINFCVKWGKIVLETILRVTVAAVDSQLTE